MRRFRYDYNLKEMVEIETRESQSGVQIMNDIKPYVSMIDGSIITSRSKHREHLRQHNCIEVGNDSSLYKPRKPLAPPPGLKETLIRVANEKLRSK